MKQNMNAYAKIEKAIQYIDKNFSDQPSLGELAQVVGLSEYHFQRLFISWAGISPKKFLQCLTAEHAKQRLLESRSVFDASLDVGLSGPSRLHDLLLTVDAMTPGEYKSLGESIVIEYGIHDSPFGHYLAARTERGLCTLTFLTAGRENAVSELKTQWPKALFKYNKDVGEDVFSSKKIELFLKGTPFQIQVWKALLEIPPGALLSYQDLAQKLKCPRSARAIGSAIGKNPIAYLIPCHRVIRKTGIIGEYRWGRARKKAMLAVEAKFLYK